jgi:hypothetical protein
MSGSPSVSWSDPLAEFARRGSLLGWMIWGIRPALPKRSCG